MKFHTVHVLAHLRAQVHAEMHQEYLYVIMIEASNTYGGKWHAYWCVLW
jgi:hypothetical protein